MNDRSPEIEAEIFLADGDRILLFRHKVGGPKTQDNLVRMRADGGWSGKRNHLSQAPATAGSQLK
jgi:hypothetical protein